VHPPGRGFAFGDRERSFPGCCLDRVSNDALAERPGPTNAGDEIGVERRACVDEAHGAPPAEKQRWRGRAFLSRRIAHAQCIFSSMSDSHQPELPGIEHQARTPGEVKQMGGLPKTRPIFPGRGRTVFVLLDASNWPVRRELQKYQCNKGVVELRVTGRFWCSALRVPVGDFGDLLDPLFIGSGEAGIDNQVQLPASEKRTRL
jgi:hypothetical protein